jgi:hypothetical protein
MQGDEGKLHADRPDIDAYEHGVPPSILVRRVITGIRNSNAVPHEISAGKTNGYGNASEHALS